MPSPRPHRPPRLALAAVALIAFSCATTSQTPADRRPSECSVDERLAGTWKSFRWSQAGPAWMRYTLRCDCTYTSRVQLLWMRITEQGSYHAADGELRFFRPQGETALPFRLEDDRLLLQEHPTEEHAYRQTDRRTCPPPAMSPAPRPSIAHSPQLSAREPCSRTPRARILSQPGTGRQRGGASRRSPAGRPGPAEWRLRAPATARG